MCSQCGREPIGYAFAGITRDYVRCSLGHVFATPDGFTLTPGR